MKCPLDGSPMDVDTDWLGRTVTLCLACDRKAGLVCLDCTTRLPKPTRKGGGKPTRCPTCRKARKRLTNFLSHRRRQKERGLRTRPVPGQCGDCGTKVTGTHWRCAPCHRLARRAWDRARYQRHKAKRLAECSRRYWANPERKRAVSRARYRRNIVAIKRRQFGKGKWLISDRKAA